MSPLRLIRTTEELSGTCYFEFLPGEYRGTCWNKQSVFLSEDVFGLFEPIVARHEPRFDHYAFVTIPRATWDRILKDVDKMSEEVGDQNEKALAGELATWLRKQLREYDSVSVLGI